jgi:hypothetical protein
VGASVLAMASACVTTETGEMALPVSVEVAEEWLPLDLDATLALEHLGDDAYQTLCNSFDGYVHDIYRSKLLIKAACTAHALQTTSDATSCAARTEQCLDTLPPVVEDQLDRLVKQAGCGPAHVSTSKCRSPVSELIRCLRDLRGIVESTGQELTCAAFGSPLPADWWRVSTPDSCIALATSCPD